MEALHACPPSLDNRKPPVPLNNLNRKTVPRMTMLLERLKDQMREMCSEGEEVAKCMDRLHTALQQYIDLHKASDSMHETDVLTASDAEDFPGLTSTPSSARHPPSTAADLSPLRVEDWIPNILRHQHTPSDIDDTYFDCSHNTLDAIDLCSDGIASQLLVYNKTKCCIVDAGAVTDQASPVNICIRGSSPVTVSSGYDSDNVMPTREDEIDLLLHGTDQQHHCQGQKGQQNPHCHQRPQTSQRSISNIQDFTKYQIPRNVPRSRSGLALKKDKNIELLNSHAELAKQNCSQTSAMPKTTHCLNRAPATNPACQSSPRTPVRHCNPNDVTMTSNDVTITSCDYAGSDNSSDYSLIDTYLEPLPSTFPSSYPTPEVTRHDESITSMQYWSDPTRSDLGYDDSFSSLSDASSLECSVRWNSGVSVSVDSGRGSWCSQDSFRCKRESISEGRVTPLSENIYETIPDDIPDESPTHFSRNDYTYDKINSSLLMDLPDKEPPQLPARNYKHSGAPVKSSSKLYPPQRTDSVPRGAKDSRAHIDDIVKNSDIVDMSSYHVYTVKDVLDSVDRFAGHLMDSQNQRIRSTKSQNGLNKKSASLKDIRDVGMSNAVSRSMSSASCKSRKPGIEYFKCGETPKPTSMIERFQMKAENEHYTAQWHVNVTGKPGTYC